jgi:prophage regulatory protein
MKLIGYQDLRPKGLPYTRQHIRHLEQAGEFPASVQLSPNRIAWRENEVDAWIAARPVRRRVRADPSVTAGVAADGGNTVAG